MSAATAATATATTARPALRFVSADTTTGIVAYAVASQHDAGRTNIISFDTISGDTFCTCRASECHRTCWHEAAVVEAWAAELTTIGVVWLTDAQLLRLGRKSATCVATYTTRVGRSLASDRLALLAARAEYRRRVRLGLIERAVQIAVPLAA